MTRAIEEQLLSQTRHLPGQVSIETRGLSPTNTLRPCSHFEVSLAPGSKPIGRSNVAVRCNEPSGWSVFVPVRIRLHTDYLISARAIAAGQTVSEADISRQYGDLSELPVGTLTDPGQALDRTTTQAIPPGRPLRHEMLRLAMVIKQGQNVKVVSRGLGFEVANEGKALNNAFEGQVAQVRLTSGQIISGIARQDGQVEVGR